MFLGPCTQNARTIELLEEAKIADLLHPYQMIQLRTDLSQPWTKT